ncbi:MAG: PDZ domain-containing protein [Bdellovibrionaceae bacterium]|nr:PDZ domain-containing protein [Pseudobdellovibrionaceae bacterium]
MYKRLFIVFVLLKLMIILGGCTSLPPVQYAQRIGIGHVKDKVFLSTYHGDMYTKLSTARNFAQIAAIDYCYELGEKAAYFHSYSDESTEEIYSHVYSTSNLYASTVLQDKTPHVYSYPMLVKIPRIKIEFSCTRNFRSLTPSPTVTPLGSEFVSPATRDFRGGLLITRVGVGGPLRKADVITHVAGKRVDSVKLLRSVLMKTHQTRLAVKILRNGKSVSVICKTSQAANDIYESNLRRLVESCKFEQEVEMPAVCSALGE